MTETTVRCDRCSAIVASDRTILAISTGPLLQSLPAHAETGKPRLDLCVECAGSLTNWLRTTGPTTTDPDEAS